MRYLIDSRATRPNRLIVTSRPGEGAAERGEAATAQMLHRPGGRGSRPARSSRSPPSGSPRTRSAGSDSPMRCARPPELRTLARVPLLSAFMCQLASEGDDDVLPARLAGCPLRGSRPRRALWHLAARGAPEIRGRRWARCPSAAAAARCRGRQADRRVALPGGPLLRLRAGDRAARASRLPAGRHGGAGALRSMAKKPRRRGARRSHRVRFAGGHCSTAPSSSTARTAGRPCSGSRTRSSASTAWRPTSPASGDQLPGKVANHRWFDASWEQIWSLAAALMDDPGRLIACFLDDSPDAWHEQTFLAARCVAGARAISCSSRTK